MTSTPITPSLLATASLHHAEAVFPDMIKAIPEQPWPQVRQYIADAFIAGAQYALSHQWISVEDDLPESNTDCIIYTHDDMGSVKMFAWFDGDNFHGEQDDEIYHPEFWMPLSTLMQSDPSNP